MHCLTCFVIENLCLRHLKFLAGAYILENKIEDCFVTHAWCAISFFLAWWKNLGWGRWTFELVAGGLLSLCNYSWKWDWRLLWCARMVCSVCFLARCKVLYWGRWNFEFVQFSLKIRLGIVLLRTHGVQYLFSWKMENSWIRQVEFRACGIILGKFLLEAFGIQSLFRCSLAHMLCTVCFTS